MQDLRVYCTRTSPWVSGGNTAYTVQTKQRVSDRESLHTHAEFRTWESVAYAPRRGVFNGGVADGVGRVRDGSREGEGESEGGGQADKKGGGKKEAM